MPRTNPAPASRSRGRLPWGSIVRSAALGVAVLAGLWLVVNVHLPSPGVLQSDIAEVGFWGFAVYVALYTVVAATPIPVTIVAVAGGLAFGLALGTLLSMIGVIAGGYIGYWIARALGRTTAREMLGSHAEAVETQLHGGGFYAVSTLRLMPGLPYWPVNYGSGAFGVDQRTFVLATIVSSLPGQLSLVAIGAFIGNPSVPNGIAVGASWLLVGSLTILAFRRWRRVAQPNVGLRRSWKARKPSA
ncbi:TVP38/TMEM64 family protein [Brevibacterium casei]|uniref:TVP38/TMEM64 family protein n=1 Tax=Brevibacterium casei TaxID=33889 RepID=UPI00223B5CA2|nr:TVP38/TMEM64 family protein [Brevibacterium casei]MCT1765799.1 TVP38/TMEM64 family protein [Brevibacterium casei]